MPGRIPDHWKDHPSVAALRARDARILANERFLEHARTAHGIALDGDLVVQRTRQAHADEHVRWAQPHDVTDHYIDQRKER